MVNQRQVLWTAGFLNERFSSPVSPLGWSWVGSLFEEMALRDPLRYMGYPKAEMIPGVRLWHGFPFANVEIFSIFYKPFPDAVVPADAVRYFPDGDVALRKRAEYPRSVVQPRFLLSLGFHLLRDPLVTTPLNWLAWDRFTPHHDATTTRLGSDLDFATNAHQVLRVLRETYRLDEQFLHIHRWSLTYADLSYRILEQVSNGHAQELMSHVPNKTQEANEELAHLGRLSPPMSAELIDRIAEGEILSIEEEATAHALEHFLERHGHRAFSLDIALATYRDDPKMLLALMERANDEQPGRFRDDVEREEWWLAPLVGVARKYARLREDQRYYWQKSLAVTRRAYLILGSDLAARSLIDRAGDVFFATRQEIADYYEMRSEPEELAGQIAGRKREWERFAQEAQERGANAYPLFLKGDVPLGEEKESRSVRDEWKGKAVSAGVARGKARIVLLPNELGKVEAGEILVTPSTDPAWTPVFGRLAGLVMERGGVLSHGAVVAREYGLPAVTAIANLTSELKDGELIEVNGESGVVRRLT